MTDVIVEHFAGPSAQVEREIDTTAGRAQRWFAAVRRFVREQPLGAVAAAGIVVITLAAIFAPVVVAQDPLLQNRADVLSSPSGAFWFGTDDLGRDVYARVIHGARASLYVGMMSVVISVVVGTLIGTVSGYLGGWVDMVLQRIIDAILAVPPIILLIFIASLLGPSVRNGVIGLAIIQIPRFARITRGEMLRIRAEEFVVAARALGARPARVILRHGVPNLVAPVIIVASLAIGQAIIAEATLAFLGLGTPPPQPSWGRMLADSQQWLRVAWWFPIFPGAFLALAVLAFNLFGDALRDHLDPKLVR